MFDILRPQVSLGEPLVGFLQVFREARRPVPMPAHIHPLDFIESASHLLPGHRRVSQEIDERLDRLLEVDVVFPERVVAVDQKELTARAGCHASSLPPPAVLRPLDPCTLTSFPWSPPS